MFTVHLNSNKGDVINQTAMELFYYVIHVYEC